MMKIHEEVPRHIEKVNELYRVSKQHESDEVETSCTTSFMLLRRSIMRRVFSVMSFFNPPSRPCSFLI